MKSNIEEQAFLDNYNPKDYEPIAVTVDVVVFGISKNSSTNYRKLDNQQLNVLLVKRISHPFKDCYAISGGFIQANETLEDTAKRVLTQKTGLNNIYFEQLYTFGEVNRDPRMRIISCAYIALLDTEKAEIYDAKWHGLDEIENLPLAFDHKNIIVEALKRLRGKINYSDIVFNMMPPKFTISQLQEVYEIILGEKLIPAAFRRTISNKIQETDEFTKDAGHRPSRYYIKKEN